MSKEEKQTGDNLVIMAGYQAIKPAEKDFDQLTQLIKEKKVTCDGMILVERDKEGQSKIASAARGQAGLGASASLWASSRHRC
jgi:uncharacterized membrane protein